eukprot:COSAG06_NODE_9563_length_1870_cov_1.399209_2_plen_332_part_00
MAFYRAAALMLRAMQAAVTPVARGLVDHDCRHEHERRHEHDCRREELLPACCVPAIGMVLRTLAALSAGIVLVAICTAAACRPVQKKPKPKPKPEPEPEPEPESEPVELDPSVSPALDRYTRQVGQELWYYSRSQSRDIKATLERLHTNGDVTIRDVDNVSQRLTLSDARERLHDAAPAPAPAHPPYTRLTPRLQAKFIQDHDSPFKHAVFRDFDDSNFKVVYDHGPSSKYKDGSVSERTKWLKESLSTSAIQVRFDAIQNGIQPDGAGAGWSRNPKNRKGMLTDPDEIAVLLWTFDKRDKPPPTLLACTAASATPSPLETLTGAPVSLHS